MDQQQSMPSVPPPVPTPVLGYRNDQLPFVSQFDANATPMWRENDRFITVLRAALPGRCVKCNEPAAYRWRRTLYWQHPAYLLFLLAGFLLGALILLAVRKQVFIDVAVCDVHRRQRTKRILIGWGAAVLSLVVMVASFFCFGQHSDALSATGAVLLTASILGLLFAIVWGIVATPVVNVRKINNGYAWYAGAGPEFLATLPAAK